VSSRAERLSALLGDAGVEVLLVTDLINVRYLTGYSGSNGIALVGPDTRAFITDFRYVEQSAQEVDDGFERLTTRSADDLLDLVEKALPPGALQLGFEAEHLSVAQHQRLRELLSGRIGLVGTVALVEGLRAVKEPQEIARIKAATALADAAFDRLLRRGLAGHTEREVALALDQDLRSHGAERVSFEPIVAAGAHGALPHARPREVEIQVGDMVVVDWGAQLDGYCSDCTRTLAAGDPGPEANEVYELVLEAQLAGVHAIAAGRGAKEVDRIAREVIEADGRGEYFGHGLGHGVGLDIHEQPRLSQRVGEDEQLQAGNVVTVEPGIYLPGRFGVRIEDLVVVTNDGCEILTSVPKGLIVVD
jgi:Xaa-Pro aminopeptidase